MKLDNRELRVWLRDMTETTGSFYCGGESAHIVTVLLYYDWIEFDNAMLSAHTAQGEKVMLIRYRLTAIGEIALGIVATEDTEAGSGVIHFEQDDGTIGEMRISNTPATPAASEATGYTVERDKQPVEYVMLATGDEIEIRSEDVPAIIEAETRALRDQLATAQAENKQLESSLDLARQMWERKEQSYMGKVAELRARIVELEQVIDDAYEMLAVPSGNDTVLISRVLDMLKPNTTHEND